MFLLDMKEDFLRRLPPYAFLSFIALIFGLTKLNDYIAI